MGKKLYPLNKIKYWLCNDIDDLCRLCKVHPKTVLSWQEKGLKPIDNKKPALFYGYVVKEFLGKMNESNKCKTTFEQMFCFVCKEGRDPLKKQIQITPNNRKFLDVKAICQSCEQEMFQSYKLEDLQQLKRIFDVVQVLGLYDSKTSPSNTPFFDQAERGKKESEKDLIQLDLFL